MSTDQEDLLLAQETLSAFRDPYLVLDSNLRVRSANAVFYQYFDTTEAAILGQRLDELGAAWESPEIVEAVGDSLRSGIPVHDLQVAHHRTDLPDRILAVNARPFDRHGEFADHILLSLRDVTDQHRAEVQVLESEMRFRRLFQTAKDGILILDSDSGRIIDANPFMCGLLGYEYQDFLNKELWEIGLFEEKEANKKAYEELLSTGYIRYEHLPLRTSSGEEVEVEFVSNLYEMGDRRVAQCNIRDITQRSRLEREAREQAVAMADLHRRKDEFLAMLSHELRNPLAPILNAVHLIRLQGSENVIQREARQIIERQVGQLAHLVNDLLEVARFTSGKVRLQLARMDMRHVVERAVESVSPQIHARRHRLQVRLPDEPIGLFADPTRLEQVVVNLLTNAAKYTDPGGEIALDLAADDNEMVLSIRDSGIGINMERYPDIFDLFIQVDRSLDRAQGGLGIGLSLVQRIVEMHGGRVQVESAGEGQGSLFTVRLPIQAYLPEEPEPTPPPSNTPGAGRVLVVDDNVDAAETLATLFRMSAHEVRTAYTGPTALEIAQAYQPEVAFLDIGLPGLSGYEVARRIRQHPALKGIRLVALTGYGQKSDLQLAREAGFDEHLVKPVDFAKVSALLSTLLVASANDSGSN